MSRARISLRYPAMTPIKAFKSFVVAKHMSGAKSAANEIPYVLIFFIVFISILLVAVYGIIGTLDNSGTHCASGRNGIYHDFDYYPCSDDNGHADNNPEKPAMEFCYIGRFSLSGIQNIFEADKNKRHYGEQNNNVTEYFDEILDESAYGIYLTSERILKGEGRLRGRSSRWRHFSSILCKN